MKPVLSAFSVLLFLSVSGCSETEAPVQPSAPAAPATTSATDSPVPPGERLVRTKVAPGKGKAVALTANQSVSGSFRSGNEGQLGAFGVRIGNYRDSSDGTLSLELCVDGNCQQASKPLAGSKDNDFLTFELARPIALSGGQQIDYTLTRSADATNRVAVWAYPAPDGQSGLTDAAGKATNLVPKLALHFRQ